MSYASPRPILAEAASPVAAAPAVNAWGIREGRPGRAAGPLPDARWSLAGTAPGLRLLPLAGFGWSGPRGLPRTRGDHVLVWMTEGAASLRLPRGEGPAPALLFLPAGTAFALHPAPGAEGTVLLVGRDLAARARTQLPSSSVDATPDIAEAEALHAALSTLAAEARREDPLARPAQEEALGRVALHLARIAARDATERPRQDPLVQRFLALATREIPAGRTLEELAAALGCTAADLDQACRARRGRPALDLFAEVNLGRAVDLLATTERPLTEIAHGCGFATAAQLGRAVLAATGSTPEALRPRRAC